LCIALLIAAPGCQKQSITSIVDVKTEITIPTILVSEAEQSPDSRELVACQIPVVNNGTSIGKLTFVGTGCSCYGVTYNDHELVAGETVEVPAGETVLLSIAGKPPLVQVSKVYSAKFHRTANDGTIEPIEVHCKLQVLDDVLITPNFVMGEFDVKDLQPIEKEMEIRFRQRGEFPAELTAEISSTSERFIVDDIEVRSPAKELEPGLWEHTWHVNATMKPQPEDASGKVTREIHVNISDESTALAKRDVSLIFHRQMPIAAPETIQFGRIKPGKSRSRQVLIRSRDNSDFLIQSPENLPTGVNVIVPKKAAARHFVEFQLEMVSEEDLHETVLLTTDHAEQNEIMIQLEALVDMPTAEVGQEQTD